MKSRFFIVLTFSIVLIFGFQQSAKADPNPNTDNGLPCTTGNDYRNRMEGPWDMPRFDEHPDIRYSPRWDIFYYAQCLDPATTSALQIVLANVIADGKITKPGCDGGRNIIFDQDENLRLCGEEEDSYVGISGTGASAKWVVAYYDPGSGGGSDPSLLADLQAARAKYGTKISHQQAAKILDTVAWNHRADNWGLYSKPNGNNCPVGSTLVSCDILFNKTTGNAYDVLSDAPGPCTISGVTKSVTSAGMAVWNLIDPVDINHWRAPIDPAGVLDGMGQDVHISDPSVCEESQPEKPPIPPDLSSTGVDVLTGKNPSVAFNPNNELWLVVAENSGKIQGQLMDSKNKPSGSLLNIGGANAHTPKVVYGQGAGKYLVVWTSGQDPSAVLWGQLVSDDGSDSGSAFQIASGGAHLYSPDSLKYDSTNQRFVLVYEKASAGTSVMIVNISNSGTPTTPTKIADVGSHNSAPSLAINTKSSEYCTIYLDKDKIKIQPVSATGTAGTATELAKGNGIAGIVYGSSDNSYTLVWMDSGVAILKTLNACADDPNVDSVPFSDKIKMGILVQNIGGYGLFSVDPAGTKDDFISFDSSGNGPAGQTIFAGTWSTDGFWLSATANPLTGMYSAVASPDGKQVKFVSGIGTLLTSSNNGAFPGSNNLSVPSRGLPTDLGQLISAIFVWSLGLIGLVIFVRFFYAGFLWFTAAGNTSRTSRAKEIMKNAVYGTLILFSAWLILNSINPDLVKSTLTLPGLPAGGAGTTGAGGGTPPGSTTSCRQQFNTTSSTGCIDSSACIDASGYTPTHDCASNNGVCLLSPPAASRVQKFITTFNTLAAGKGCTLRISSTIQVNNGVSSSLCHKPGNSKSGTCADFNILPNQTTCTPYFYQAAKDSGAVVSFQDEYVCPASTTTGGNIHVDF